MIEEPIPEGWLNVENLTVNLSLVDRELPLHIICLVKIEPIHYTRYQGHKDCDDREYDSYCHVGLLFWEVDKTDIVWESNVLKEDTLEQVVL